MSCERMVLLTMDLTLIAGLLIVFGVAMYVILDGFDLGVGILFPSVPLEGDRELLIASIAPVWDGNETWLVLGGVLLFAAFPGAYALLLPAWYLPLLLFLFALVFRGVSFEFRPRSQAKWIWAMSFSLGSILATFAQGLLLGSFVHGFDVSGGKIVGGPFAWLTPFSVMTGAGLVAGYALLGATWLIYKTDGSLQDWCYATARRLMFVVLAFIAAVSIWTPLALPAIAARWFSWPNLLYLSPVPIATAACAYGLWRALAKRHERAPFLYAIALFLLGFLGLAVSTWPYAVPRAVTVWEAAAAPASQAFILIGVLVLLPLVL